MYQYVSQYDSSHPEETALHTVACGVMDMGVGGGGITENDYLCHKQEWGEVAERFH